MKKSIVLATAIASVMASGSALAELSGNAAFSNNYIWRGVTQTQNAAAISGGLDYGHDSGFYAGTWIGNVDFTDIDGQKGYEMDVYAGFGGEAGSLGYDVGVITYQYPMEPNINFTEVYASGTFSLVTVGVAYTVDAASFNGDKPDDEVGAFAEGDLYVSASIDFEAGGNDMSVYAGSYAFDGDGNDVNGDGVGDELDYVHYGVSLSKDSFTFALDKNDIESDDGTADNVRFTVTYGFDVEL